MVIIREIELVRKSEQIDKNCSNYDSLNLIFHIAYIYLYV